MEMSRVAWVSMGAGTRARAAVMVVMGRAVPNRESGRAIAVKNGGTTAIPGPRIHWNNRHRNIRRHGDRTRRRVGSIEAEAAATEVQAQTEAVCLAGGRLAEQHTDCEQAKDGNRQNLFHGCLRERQFRKSWEGVRVTSPGERTGVRDLRRNTQDLQGGGRISRALQFASSRKDVLTLRTCAVGTFGLIRPGCVSRNPR